VSQTKPLRPLYFVASYPRSGSHWVRSLIYLVVAQLNGVDPDTMDMRNIDNVIPWDVHGALYKAVTGSELADLKEEEVAAARPQVHAFWANQQQGLPVVRTQAARGMFYGHPTINHHVARGGVYIVRNPLDVAAGFVESSRQQPLRIIGLMMTADRRVKMHESLASEPQGSWTQNVESWTAKPDPNMLVLRFEDLAKTPAREFSKLMEHMKIPAKTEHVTRAITKLAEERKGKTRLAGTRDYRKHLGPIEARALVEVHALQMDRHGYLTQDVLDYAMVSREDALRLSAKNNQRAIG
jgi:hypothetical protein